MDRIVKLLNATVALALPPRCPGCGVPGDDDHQFCPVCWSALRFLGPPWCATCNMPFDHARGEDVRCAGCIADPPRHAGIRAAVAYGDIARGLALKLKYGNRTGVAETMARLMLRSTPDDIELLIPVPLHRRRLWSRGYNQAALIASAMARRRGIPSDKFALVRTRHTPPLRGLGGPGRWRAVAGAFRVAYGERIVGRRIGLVDDVLTSGATAEACTLALLRAGARSVTILCWARVLPDGAGD